MYFHFSGKYNYHKKYTLYHFSNRPTYYSWSNKNFNCKQLLTPHSHFLAMHCQINYLGIILLSFWDVQHDLSLTVIALKVSYLIGHFVISANSMQFAFYIIPTARKYKWLTVTSNQRKNMNKEKIKLFGNFCIYTFQNSYFFQCLSWYLWMLSACWLVTLLYIHVHSVQFPY